MSKRTAMDLKELFRQASEIAQQVPESMQEAAFNRALDLLTGSTKQEPVVERATLKNTERRKTSQQTNTDENQSSANDLFSAIDSTEHPGVTAAKKVLDRSLMVLQIALTAHDVDGLTPSDVANVLTNKFRVRTTYNAVSMALGKATTLVDRVPSGSGYRYRIMASGEKYLTNLDDTQAAPSRPKKQTPKKRPASKGSISKKKTVRKNTRTTKGVGRKNITKGNVGPKAAVISLIDAGFFSKGRTGPEVQAYLKNKRGVNIGTAQLRLAMLRLLRDVVLERDQNADGQYEYKKSKS